MEKYGWERHDGEQFGRQELYDGDYHITTLFAKRFFYEHRGGDWAVRVIARQRRRKATGPQGAVPQDADEEAEEAGRTRFISFIMYIADEGVRLPSTVPLPYNLYTTGFIPIKYINKPVNPVPIILLSL